MGKFEDKTTYLVTETYIQLLMHQLQKELSQYYTIVMDGNADLTDGNWKAHN